MLGRDKGVIWHLCHECVVIELLWISLERCSPKSYLEKFVLFFGRQYVLCVILSEYYKTTRYEKNLLSGKLTYVLSVVWVNQTIKWKKKKFKNTFRTGFSNFFAFLLEIHCLSSFPHLLKSNLYLSLVHPRDWRPLTLLCFKLLTYSSFIAFIFSLLISVLRASLIAQLVKNLPAMQETPVQFLGWEDPLEQG